MATCLGKYSRSGKLSGRQSSRGEYSRSSSLTRPGVEKEAEEVSTDYEQKCEDSREEEKFSCYSVSSAPDSWSAEQSGSSEQWEGASVSLVQLPMPFGCNRERLQQHRLQVAGQVSIPETWSGEQNLLDWVDPEPMDEALSPLSLTMARSALLDDKSRRR